MQNANSGHLLREVDGSRPGWTGGRDTLHTLWFRFVYCGQLGKAAILLDEDSTTRKANWSTYLKWFQAFRHSYTWIIIYLFKDFFIIQTVIRVLIFVILIQIKLIHFFNKKYAKFRLAER